jgi:cell division transport system permease protein
MRAQFVFSEIGTGLKRNLTMTIAVIVSSAVALAMLGAAGLMMFQVSKMKGYWYDKVEVTVYLCNQEDASSYTSCAGGATTAAQRQGILADLNKIPAVQQVYYEDAQEAYQRYVEQFKNSPLKSIVTPEQIGDDFRVKLKNANDGQVIIGGFSGRPGVAQVIDQKQQLSNLFKLINGLRNCAAVVALLMVALAMMLIVNTVRLSAFSRRRETGIMRLVGASNFYIRLPFLMEGAIAGLLGAAFACGGVALLKAVLIDKVLAPTFTFSPFVGWDQVLWPTVPALLAIGVLMSVLASVLTIRKYLRV